MTAVQHQCSSLRSHIVDILIQETTSVVLVAWLFNYQTKALVCLIDRWDDQGRRLYTSIITVTWTEDWTERLIKGVASSRVDTNPGFHIGFFNILNLAAIPEKRVLTCRSGLVWKSSSQTGHLYWTFPSQNFVIQVLQKLCPHGVETGLLNTSRQMGHEKFSDQVSDQVLAEAIPRHRQQGLCIEQVHSFH